MFGFGLKLPISEEDRLWVDDGFVRLAVMLGRERMMTANVVLPEDRYFPDHYDGSKASVIAMAERVATYMGVPTDAFTIEIFAEDEEAWRESMPHWHGKTNDAGGLYFHYPENGRFLVGIHANKLKESINLVATLAHELAHVLLLGGGLLDSEITDMEPLTDLCTVFLGFGFFNASAAFRFKQWNESGEQGWCAQKSGYLPEQIWGYALARFAKERGEIKPIWAKTLPTNVRSYFMQSLKWLEKHSSPVK